MFGSIQNTTAVPIGLVTIPVTFNCDIKWKEEITGKHNFDCSKAQFVWPNGCVKGDVSVTVEPYARVGVVKLVSVGVYSQIKSKDKFYSSSNGKSGF